ncbi:MAG TPA: flagellar protein FlaG [Nitrospiraceae bacterium]|nr:flagellar protein FlaG [Nitrospiraceae bacterium]
MNIDNVVKRDAIPAAHARGDAAHGPETQAAPQQRDDVTHGEPTNVDRKAIEQAISKIQGSIGQVDSSLRIEVDSDIHRIIVKVINNQSGEVIRQIPSQEIVEISKRLDAMQGLLLTKRT